MNHVLPVLPRVFLWQMQCDSGKCNIADGNTSSDRVTQHSPVWPQTHNPPAPASHELGGQVCSSHNYLKNLNTNNINTIEQVHVAFYCESKTVFLNVLNKI